MNIYFQYIKLQFLERENFFQTGRQIFACVGDRVSTFLSYADKGSTFVFGYLVTGQPFNPNPNENLTGINETASEISEIFNSQGYLSGLIFHFYSIHQF